MNAFNFSPDDGNFCQFMNQNVPKPMFLGLDSVGALIFIFPKTLYTNMYFRPIQGPDGTSMEGPSRAHMERPCRAHPGSRWSALAGPIQGPDGAAMQAPSRA